MNKLIKRDFHTVDSGNKELRFAGVALITLRCKTKHLFGFFRPIT